MNSRKFLGKIRTTFREIDLQLHSLIIHPVIEEVHAKNPGIKLFLRSSFVSIYAKKMEQMILAHGFSKETVAVILNTKAMGHSRW